MKEPVNGLRFIVTGQEMYDHLHAKAAEHRLKARRYKEQAESLPEPMRGQTNDPGYALEQKQREHERKAALFEFMVDHLDKTLDYNVSESDHSHRVD